MEMSREPPIPWLMISHGKDEDRHTFFNISKNRYYSNRIAEMRNKYVWSSPCGWWIVDDLYTVDCFLFNPRNMEKIQLPPLEPCSGRSIIWLACILSAPPDDPKCYVLFLNSCNSVYFCQPGDEKFVQQKLDTQLLSVTTVGGNVFGEIIDAGAGAVSVLASITFGERNIQFREIRALPRSCFLEAISGWSCLLESSGDILYVVKNFSASYFREVISIKIFRWDWESRWTELDSIGDRAIFLGVRDGISASVVDQGIDGNRIYFIESRNLYVFNVQDGSITSSVPCPIASPQKAFSRWVLMPPNKYLDEA